MMQYVAVGLGAILLLLSNGPAQAQESGLPYWKERKPYTGHWECSHTRHVYLLNAGWEYLEQDLDSLTELDGLHWQRIDLPHTWNRFDATDNIPGYRREASWYRKSIYLSKVLDDALLRLYFEGVNITSQIYVNGEKAGEHLGGYVGFTVDISRKIRLGALNEILVRVDNSINPDIIPSQKSDFVIFGGITRDVWLQVLPPIFVDRVQIRTPFVNSEWAATEITFLVQNSYPNTENVSLRLAIQAPEGDTVARISANHSAPPGASILKLEMPVVLSPKLWSPDTPNLYTARIELERGRDKDAVSEQCGYRWFEFKEHGPFYLNGKRLLLRGTHRHEDHAGYGSAIPDSLHRRDLQMIKDLGANFVRLAHYPQDPEVYRACDELGLIVWDELPWCRGGMGGDEWKANTRRLLVEQIEQNMNHPSIVFWSLGNEMYWLPDFPNGDHPDSWRQFVRELNELAHELDPGRLTTMRKFYEGAEITDVFSPSIWAGWYSGVYRSYEEALTKSRKQYRRFLHAEYGGDSHVGRHTENPFTGESLSADDGWAEQPTMLDLKQVSNEGDWSESYIVDLLDWHLMISERLEWFAGNAQWAFKDFATPLRPENPIPYVNQKGLVDRAGNPKDAYYVFKSRWTDRPKFCYIQSHTWTHRHGEANQPRQVRVYSNCEEVALYLNGELVSRKRRDCNEFPACGLHWDLLFRKGLNNLLAVGYANGQETARDSMTVQYELEKSGKPAELKLSSQRLPNGNHLIEARVVDEEGRLCLDFNERVYFDHNGDGALLADYGTPTRSSVIEFASGEAAIEFAPVVGGRAVIEARTQEFKGSYLVIE